ncbi:unnamed protein product, partial [Cuscuta epithymum]
MDDSRLFTVGFDDEPPTSPLKQPKKTKRKRLRKAGQGTSSQSAPLIPEQSEPVRDVEPVQQVDPDQQSSHADMLMDQLFSDQQPHHFSAEEVAANQADLASQFEQIS